MNRDTLINYPAVDGRHLGVDASEINQTELTRKT